MTDKTRKQQLEEMLTLEPGDPELHYMLAMEYVSEGNDEEAMRHFQEINTKFPDYPPAYHMGGQALVRLNKIEEAKTLLQAGIATAHKAGNDHAAGEMAELLETLE